MATRIFRVDLADDADDFQHIALEPGLPLIDQANVNSQILFKWCGDLVAAPQIEGESINFYVRHPQQGRLSGINVYPVKEKDLEGPLKEDLEELQRTLRKGKPETSTEQAVYATAKASLKKLTDEGASTLARQSAFFKYRYEKGPWRLVWCWGFQRKETQPAPTAVCRNPQCNLLYLNRPGMKSHCPDCQQISRRKKGRSPLVGALPLLLLFLIAAGLLLWFLNKPRLVVMPAGDEITAPVGSRISFIVHRKTLFSDEDVSGRVTALSDNTRVLAFAPGSIEAIAKGLGQSRVHFVLEGIATEAYVTIDPRGNPTELYFESDDIELGIGATRRLKVMGRYDDGEEFDLTDATRFEPEDTSFVHVDGAMVQGTAEGSTTIRAIFNSQSDSQAVEATSTVTVVPRTFTSLTLAMSPASLVVGQAGQILASAEIEDGDPESVVGSGMLSLRVEPADSARIEDGYLYAQKPGTVKLIAEFQGLPSQQLDIEITAGSGDGLHVAPADLELAVDERYYLDVRADGAFTITSSDPTVVQAAQDGGSLVTAVAEGTAQLVVRTGTGQEKTVSVTVIPIKFDSIAFQPGDASIPVGQSVPFSVIGVTEDGVEIALDGKKLTWKHPDPKYVTIDTDGMYLSGNKLTDEPQAIGVSYGGHETTALVAVIAGAPVSDDPLLAILAKGGGLKHHDLEPFVQQQVITTVPTYGIGDGGGLIIKDVPDDRIFRDIFSTGDVIQFIDGIPVTRENYETLLRERIDGLQRVPIRIFRDGVEHTVFLEPDVRVVLVGKGDSDETTFTVKVTVVAPTALPGTELRLTQQDDKASGPWARIDPDTKTATLTSPRLKKLGGFDVSYSTFVEVKPTHGPAKRYPYTFRLRTTVEEGGQPSEVELPPLPNKVLPLPVDPLDDSVEKALNRTL